MTAEILVLYYSVNGSTKKLAQFIARGIESINGVSARLRTVPRVSAISEQTADLIPDSGVPYAENSDLVECAGLALGSPVRFANMASPMKYFWDNTSAQWLNGTLVGKPACVFTSGSSMHGGQEMCLFSMMLPLMHHGMLLTGLPYTEIELTTTKEGGTPYGASHVSGINSDAPISETEKKLAIAQGKRLAELVLQLNK